MNAPPISAQLWLRQPAKEIELADGRVYLIEFGPLVRTMSSENAEARRIATRIRA